MHDAALLRRGDCVRDRDGHREEPPEGKAAAGHQPRQRPPLDPAPSSGSGRRPLLDRVDADDVGMVEGGQAPRASRSKRASLSGWAAACSRAGTFSATRRFRRRVFERRYTSPMPPWPSLRQDVVVTERSSQHGRTLGRAVDGLSTGDGTPTAAASARTDPAAADASSAAPRGVEESTVQRFFSICPAIENLPKSSLTGS